MLQKQNFAVINSKHSLFPRDISHSTDQPLKIPIPSMAVNTHTLSMNIYGRGDATLGDGPSHMGLALHEKDSSTCIMHHIRNPVDEVFIYDPRPQPLHDPVLRGRCELLTSISPEEVSRVSELLSDFGNDGSNIPEFGVGNCQDWVANAVGALESKGILEEGEGVFWTGMINKSAEGMKRACIEAGRRWIDGPDSEFNGVPDARFKDRDGEERVVGKLAQNPDFKARMQALLGKDKSKGNDKGSESERLERPFYVSSPFFSTLGERRE
ncbi:uncharacterized protein BJX67DRAFT_352202 [Aspergillus lucknowensis]|uniref:Uncharacterized protein n=1 Tax=Aspergillus lucknowensis TaxID=176173 RepID=A0ABR4LT95_9EURO